MPTGSLSREMTDWNIAVGQSLLRSEIHHRCEGGRFGGMEPAVRANSIFLFSKPSVGAVYGYKYDGWRATAPTTTRVTARSGIGGPRRWEPRSAQGAFTGPHDSPFRSEGTSTTYLGAF